MAFTASEVAQIRVEIGDIETNEIDYVDFDVDLPGVPPALGSLETIYNDSNLGASSILKTALVVYKHRYHNHRNRSFDISKEGNWLARSQKTRFLAGRVKELEALTGSGKRSKNMTIVSDAELDTIAST